MVKNPTANAGDAGDVDSSPGLGRFSGEGNGNPLQYSCLGNPMDRETWWATVHRVARSWTQQLSIMTVWVKADAVDIGVEDVGHRGKLEHFRKC